MNKRLEICIIKDERCGFTAHFCGDEFANQEPGKFHGPTPESAIGKLVWEYGAREAGVVRIIEA